MSVEQTNRGFSLTRFTDCNGVACTVQASSLATDECIWVGAEEIGLKHFVAYLGWQDVELTQTVSEHYVANNRMHLDREQAGALADVLRAFADTGQIIDHGPAPRSPSPNDDGLDT